MTTRQHYNIGSINLMVRLQLRNGQFHSILLNMNLYIKNGYIYKNLISELSYLTYKNLATKLYVLALCYWVYFLRPLFFQASLSMKLFNILGYILFNGQEPRCDKMWMRGEGKKEYDKGGWGRVMKCIWKCKVIKNDDWIINKIKKNKSIEL
ncbi:unnamed protein product [Paramecium octaurelia]|uniref:Uncharacterized protein n=1 Tax=Paramecium octaurelia TaxID=43137 RepID=A0A8S1Y2I1_PAROT|nr:unnamed protein product [Paramecium octaurelia]